LITRLFLLVKNLLAFKFNEVAKSGIGRCSPRAGYVAKALLRNLLALLPLVEEGIRNYSDNITGLQNGGFFKSWLRVIFLKLLFCQ